MDLRDLRYFVAAAEERSFTRAARRCFVAQQGLSAAIARLERSIGERLFERGGRGVDLTPAGARLLPRARELLRLADETLDAVREAPAERPGALRVGIVTPAAAELTSPILRTFRRRHPRVAVSVRELGFGDLVDALSSRAIDVGIGVGPSSDGRIERTPLFVEPQVAILPRWHPLADAPSLRVEDLVDEVFVSGATLPREWIGHWRFEQQRGAPARLAPPWLSEARTPSEINEVVAAGNAIITGPMSHGRLLPHPLVVCVPVVDAPGSEAGVAVAAQEAPPDAIRFREVAREVSERLRHAVPGASRPQAV